MEKPPPGGRGGHSPSGPSRPRHTARTRWFRGLAWVLAGLLALMVLVQFGGSPFLTRFVNRKLAALPGYAGSVERVRILPWMAALKLENFVLSAREAAPGDEPILRLPRAAITVAWRDLARGRIRAEALVEDTALAVTPGSSRSGPGQSKKEKEREKEKRIEDARRWQATLRDAFPLELSRLEISRLRVHYLDRSVEPHAELILEGVHLVMKGLRNRPKPGESLPATLVLDAKFPAGGSLHVAGSADPWARPLHFDANMEVRDLALPPLDGFVRDEAGVVVTSGTFEVFAEAHAAGGGYTGYLKPFFKDLKFKPVPKKNILKQAAVVVASAATTVLKNDQDKIATKIPFEGNFEDPNVEVWTAVENLLRNAFVQALREGFERR